MARACGRPGTPGPDRVRCRLRPAPGIRDRMPQKRPEQSGRAMPEPPGTAGNGPDRPMT